MAQQVGFRELQKTAKNDRDSPFSRPGVYTVAIQAGPSELRAHIQQFWKESQLQRLLQKADTT